MAALTPTLVVSIDSSAGTKVTKVFTATPTTATDTISLSSYFSSCDAVTSLEIIGGQDAALSFGNATVSGTTVTLDLLEQDGTAATDFTGASIQITVIGSQVTNS